MGIEQQKTPVCKRIYSLSGVLKTVLMGEWPLHDQDVFCSPVSGGNSSNFTFEILCPTIFEMLILFPSTTTASPT
mgnify:CR=1 FL=1